jgi:hypothetical protein
LNVDAEMGEDASGGYVTLQFPEEAPVEVWLHHACLRNDAAGRDPLAVRTSMDHGAPRPKAACPHE